jgi:Flp pilus assembly protein TadB
MTMARRTLRALSGLALVGSLLALSSGLPAVAAPNQPTGRISNVKTTPGEVDLTLTVTGLPEGTSVDPDSVTVSVGGHELDSVVRSAQVLKTSSKHVVREAVLAFDASHSMGTDGIAAARAAAISYAQTLPASVRIGVVAFANTVTTLLEPTTDRTALANALPSLSTTLGTKLYDGVSQALDLTKGLPADAQRRLLVLSDGADVSSSESLASLLTQLRAEKVPADVVAFRQPRNPTVLKEIAQASGGTVLPVDDAGGLADAFTAAAGAFGQRVQVAVAVPHELDQQAVTLRVGIAAGTQTIFTDTRATLQATKGTANGALGTRTGSIKDNGLIVILAIAFVAMLAVALVLLLVPVARHERAAWDARLAEASRYRVVRSVGQESSGLAVNPEEDGAIAKRALSVVDRAMRARGQREKLLSELERAGLRMRPEEWAVLQLAAILALAAVAFALFRSPIGVPIGGLLGWFGCRIFIRAKIDRRAKAFEEQLADNLQLLSGSLRSGFSLAQALATVVREGTEPTASEFTRALTEVRLGAILEDALDRVADRMKCEDLTWVVMAIRISREVGGNLAEVLDNTVETMRERARLRGTVRVLTAEGRLSARILTALPIFVGTIFIVVRPTYVHPLFHTTTGLIMFTIGVLELILGAVWLNRLTKIEV